MDRPPGAGFEMPIEDLNPLLLPILKKCDLPALAAAWVTTDGLAALGAVGVRKFGGRVRVTPHDRFHLGSNTKAMTATLLATLVEQGSLSWDTTLASALPDLAADMHQAYRPVTLQQLLAHRAGFPAATWPRGINPRDVLSVLRGPREQRHAYSRRVLREPPEVPPGARFLYANRSYIVAGAIAERIADAPWEQLMRDRLFSPLGMASAGFGAMGSPRKVDEPWQHTVAKGKHRPIGPGPRSDNPPFTGPAGRVHSSLPHWARFVTAHLRGAQGLPGILQPATFHKLQSAATGDYAFGWGAAHRPWAAGRLLAHAGSNTLSFAVAWMAPLRGFALLVASNQGGEAAAEGCGEAARALVQRFVPAS